MSAPGTEEPPLFHLFHLAAELKRSTDPIYREVAAHRCESLRPHFLSCFHVDKECNVLGRKGKVISADKLLLEHDRHPGVKEMAPCTTKGISACGQEQHDLRAPTAVADVIVCLSDMLDAQKQPSCGGDRHATNCFSILADETIVHRADTISECFPEIHAFFKKHSLGGKYKSLRGFPYSQAHLENTRAYEQDRCILLGDPFQLDAKKVQVKVEPIVCFVLPPGTELPHPFQYVPDNTSPGRLFIAPCLGIAACQVYSSVGCHLYVRAKALEVLPWKVHCLQLKVAPLPPKFQAPFDSDTHRLACIIFDYFEDLCAEQESARASEWLACVFAASYPALHKNVGGTCFSARNNAKLLTIVGGVTNSYDNDDAVAATQEIASISERLSIAFSSGIPACFGELPMTISSSSSAEVGLEHSKTTVAMSGDEREAATAQGPVGLNLLQM